MMRPIYIIFSLLCCVASVSAQSPADSLAALLPGKAGKERVAFINEHFYTFYSNDFDEAVKLVEEAKTLAEQNGWQDLQALSLRNLGIIRYLKADYEQALTSYHQALSIYEKTGDNAGRGFTLKELGNYYKKQKKYETALEKLKEGLAACQAANNDQCYSEVLDIQGVVFLEMGKLDEAEAVFQKEKAVLLRLNNDRSMSYVLDHLSEVAILRGRHEQAIGLLQESAGLRQKVGDLHGVAITTNNMGEAMLQAKQPAKAIPFFADAVQRSTAIGFDDLRRHAMQQLSAAYAETGQPALAMDWLQKSVALKDSMFNVERSRQLAEMEAKYDTEKKEAELARQQVKLQRRTSYLLLAGALLLALSAIFVAILRQQKLKQREAELQAGLATAEAANRLQEERLRISRDLHDNLGAELTIIGSALSRRAFQVENEQERQELEAIGGNARQAMGQLRETIWAIRHEQFSVAELAEKISDFAVRATPLPVEVRAADVVATLSPTQTLNLFRIAQEAITNAVKYAGATAITVVFEKPAPNLLALRICDDGHGFDVALPAVGNGLGNMRARAEELGGSLQVSSSEGGTTIVAQLPI